MNRQSDLNNFLLGPVLLMMCMKSDTEEKLGYMSSLIEAMFATIQTFRLGLENFQSSMAKAFPDSNDNQKTPEDQQEK